MNDSEAMKEAKAAIKEWFPNIQGRDLLLLFGIVRTAINQAVEEEKARD